MSEQTGPTDGAGGHDGPASVAEHLENSKRLAEEAHQGWQDLPAEHEADDAHHPGEQGQQAPAD
ncbi:hypothetical protein ACFEMC_11920 [Kineococcus sp. DHX-1]|uniref:hypothetical protein n=1 Tax=Kineococcus sp. DHX-1 TaxID=3349638 RepID=UPI0036D39BA0